MTTIVEPRPCKTCGEPANYIGTSATGTAFACPACADTSWYYEDEPEPDFGGPFPQPEDLCPGCGQVRTRLWCWNACTRPDVSMALAEHTAHALNTLSGMPDIPRHRALEETCLVCLLPLPPEHVEARQFPRMHDVCAPEAAGR